MKLGNAIKQIRQQYGWSQVDLSGKTGIAQTHLSQIESGDKNPSRKTIEKICEAFDIPEAVLYVMGMDDNDAPDSRKDIFKDLYPAVRDFALQIIDKHKAELLKKDE